MKTKRLNIVINGIVVIIASSLMFSACDRETNNIQSVEELSTKTLGIPDDSPFDYYGEKHNEYLYIIGKAMQNDLDSFSMQSSLSEDDVVYLLDKMLATLNSEFKARESYNEYTMNYDFFNRIISDDITDDSVYFLQLNGLLASVDTTLSVAQQVEQIRTIELDFLHDKMSRVDSMMAISLNILSHSLVFWEDVRTSEDNPWHNFVTSDFEPFEWGEGMLFSNGPIKKIGDFFHKIGQKVKKFIQSLSTEEKEQIALVDCATGLTAGLSLGPGWGIVSAIATSIGNAILNH